MQTEINTFKCCQCHQVLDISNFFIKKNSKPFHYCKSCWNAYIAKRLVERKNKLIEMMGGKCEKCGYNKCNAVLDFHHIDPSIKEYTISTRNLSLKKITEEVKKCILLCANCHRELHSNS